MNERKNDVPAISKMNQIFDLLASEEISLSQAEISSKLGIPKASVSRIINLLSGMGYLEQDPKNGFCSLGPKLLSLGNIVNKRLNLSTVAKPLIEKLSKEINEMVKLSIFRGDVIYPVISCESTKAMRITLNTGTVFRPNIGAAGKLLLALTEEGYSYIKNRLPELELGKSTPYSITDPEELLKKLEEIRRNNYAVDFQEESEGIYAVAAPVYNANGNVIAALSIPFFGDFNDKKEKYIPIVIDCANDISRGMGFNIGGK